MRPSTLLAALATAACASAQVVPIGFSGGIAVQAGAATAVLLPGVDITTGAHLVTGGGLSGSAWFHCSPAWDDARVELAWDVGCAANAHTATASGGATRHELWSARPIDGRFVVTWTPTTAGTGAASFAFDLFDDGVIDATASTVIPLTLPVGMTVLRVDTAASATAGVFHGPWGIQIPYQGTASGALTVRFEPTHCAVTPFGTSCGTTTLDAVPNFFGAASLAAQCPPGADIAIAVLGFDQVPTPLPFAPGCTLHTTPLLSTWQSVVNGGAEWTLVLPVGAGAVAFAAQVVTLDVTSLHAEATPGCWIVCP